jgi:succinate dehydrogenase/fumarate reductase cytochrome b subunit
MYVEINGLLGLILLILDVWAIVRTLSSGAGTGAKVLWVIIVLLLPLLGFILWLILGPKGQAAAV